MWWTPIQIKKSLSDDCWLVVYKNTDLNRLLLKMTSVICGPNLEAPCSLEVNNSLFSPSYCPRKLQLSAANKKRVLTMFNLYLDTCILLVLSLLSARHSQTIILSHCCYIYSWIHNPGRALHQTALGLCRFPGLVVISLSSKPRNLWTSTQTCPNRTCKMCGFAGILLHPDPPPWYPKWRSPSPNRSPL